MFRELDLKEVQLLQPRKKKIKCLFSYCILGIFHWKVSKLTTANDFPS